MLVENAADSRLLAEFLGRITQEVRFLDPAELNCNAESLSLVIADVASAGRHGSQLIAMKQHLLPRYLPLLLLLPKSISPSPWLQGGFDDVLHIPLQKDELAARVNVFLRLREYSEAAIKQNQERFRATFDRAPVGVAHTAPDGKFLLVNQKFGELLGYSESELTGIAFSDVTHPDDIDKSLSLRNALIEQGPMMRTTEKRYVHRDGRSIWVSLAVSVVPDSAGRPDYFITMAEDITGRKQREEESRRFRAAMDVSADSIFLIDPQAMRFIDVNDAACRNLAYGREELLALGLQDLLGTTRQETACTYATAIGNSGRSLRSEGTMRSRDGCSISVELSCSAVPSEQGHIIVCTARDITERQRIMSALRDSERFAKATIDALSAQLCVVDEVGTIVAVNKAWEDFALANGSSSDRVSAGINYLRVCEQSTGEDAIHALAFADGLRDVLAGQRSSLAIEYPCHSPSEQVWMVARVARFHGGAPVRAVIVHENISERKLAEAAVRDMNITLERRIAERTLQLQNANEDLAAFSHSVSHDLRAPLRVINGFSEILAADHAANLDNAAKDLLERLRAASQRMERMIDGMLELSRVTTNGITCRSLNLSVKANQIVAELRRQDPARQAEIDIAADIEAWGDSTMAYQILENLLGNAWKYTAKKSVARITFGNAVDGNGRKAFCVRDNGAGFNMQFAGKLFQPFVRMHTSGEFPGTGIGLATVKRIVQWHGGEIWAESIEQQGTAIYFTLAAADTSLRTSGRDARETNSVDRCPA